MFSKALTALAALSVLAVTQPAAARERWLERDNRAVFLHPRRFGQENPEVLQRLAQACGNGVCATLAGQAIGTLLAGAGECAQQDHADAIIDAAAQFDATTQANLIQLAIEFRQAEKNTPPDFTTNPPTLRNSVFCQKAPKNPQLNDLVQAQDPDNDPNIFFDPATRSSVIKGTQANTIPFGSNGGDVAAPPAASPSPVENIVETTPTCGQVTVSVTATDAAVTNTAAVTVSVGIDAPAATAVPAGGIGDFGICSVPEIEFGVGFDGRKETSFQPVDKTSYNHGSAQNVNIITQFICDTLVNRCKADQQALDTCATAQAAASAAATGTGAQADAFNAVFGVITNFVSVASVDNQGRVVPDTGSDASSASASQAPTEVATAPPAGQTLVAPSADDDDDDVAPVPSTAPSTAPSTGNVGDFGICSVPEIEFGVGFDNRRETSFQPVDKASYNQGSAQNVNIITQFICDALVNRCGADQQARDTCDQARAAASAAAVGTGAQADAFNAVFGVSTNFAAVASVDNQGRVVAGTGAGNGGNTGNTDGSNNAVPSTAVTKTSAAATQTQGNNNNSAGGNLQSFSGALGGVSAPVVTALGDGQFQVEGNAAFNNLQNALVRSCDVQNNQCANAANASGNADFTVAQCNQQQQQCTAQARSS